MSRSHFLASRRPLRRANLLGVLVLFEDIDLANTFHHRCCYDDRTLDFDHLCPCHDLQ